jgi:hypothetical protein
VANGITDRMGINGANRQAEQRMGDQQAADRRRMDRREEAAEAERQQIGVRPHQCELRINDENGEQRRDDREDDALDDRPPGETAPEEESIEDRPAHADAEMRAEAGGIADQRRTMEFDGAQLPDQVDHRQARFRSGEGESLHDHSAAESCADRFPEGHNPDHSRGSTEIAAMGSAKRR